MSPNRLRWAGKMDNLPAYEAYTSALRADSGYAALLAKGSDLFIAGSINDEFWRSG